MVDRKKPNFLVIIADDLGFSDIGCYGSEIQTPALDALAEEGVRMLNYHTAAACSPTRAMVMSGTDAHLGGLGCLIEYKGNEKGAQRWAGKAGYEGYLNYDVPVLSEILEDNGYVTLLSGKWHLGMQKAHGPWARGFQRSFTMLPGCSNHYGYEPVLESGYSGMPVGGRPIHAEDGVHVKITPNKTDDPKGFYSSNCYSDKMVDYLSERSDEDKAKPFFGYLAYSAPHWPLQSPKATREKYRGMYADGPYALRQKRLAKLVDMGLINAAVVPHEIVAPEKPEWDHFTEYERQCSCRAMEAYAGMVEQMDTGIGRVLDYLKKTGEYDNTFIVFMSDNGAEGAAMEAYPVLGDKIKEAIHAHFDNSLENIGNWNSYTWLGPLWAQASTAPSRLYKCFPSEGGILVPAIVKPPKSSMQGFSPGGIDRSFATCMDLAPTFLNLIQLRLPAAPRPAQSDTNDSARKTGGKPSAMRGGAGFGLGRVIHRGKEVFPMTGCSWVPHFSVSTDGENGGASAADEWGIYPADRPVGWELHAQAALRKGNWKIVHLLKTHGGKGERDSPDGWELFDLSADPGETIDLSDREPDKLKELLAHWEGYVVEAGLVWGPHAMDAGVSAADAPHLHESDIELQKTWLQAPAGAMTPA